MSKVDIKIGFRCNNLCKFCVQGDKRKSICIKNKKVLEMNLLEAYSKGKREIVFTGGEPCLHPDIFKLIEYAREIGYKEIQIQTNGRMFFYKDFCLRCIDAGTTQFLPAIHGPTAKIHDYLTSVPGSFWQTLQGINNLKSLGQRVLTNTVITSLNYKSLPRLAKLLVSLGVEQFQFAFIHILGTAFENKNWIVPRKIDVMPYIIEGLIIGEKAGIRTMTEAIPYCLLNGNTNFVAEEQIPETTVYDGGYKVENYAYYRRNFGKIKRKECHACKYYNDCEGPWKEYVELYGWSEFIPCCE